MTRPATPPCGHVDEHVYYRTCHPGEPKAGTQNTHSVPWDRAACPHQLARLGRVFHQSYY